MYPEKRSIFSKTVALTQSVLAASLFLVVTGKAQGANCQAGTGPFAGHETATEFNAAVAASPSVCAFDPAANAAALTNIRSMLLYDWSDKSHTKTHTQRHMYRLSRKYGFRLTRSQSQTYITPATLEGVDIVVFNNGDQDPLQDQTSLTAMRNFVEIEGRGMMAIHAALAFIPCPSEDVTVASLTSCRWFLRAYRTQFHRHLNHVSQNTVRIYVDSVVPGEIPPNALGADITPATVPHGIRNDALKNIFLPIAALPPDQHLPANGGTSALAASVRNWEGAWDEWYSYRNHPRRAPVGTFAGIPYGPVHMLLSIDENSYPNSGTGSVCNEASPCKTGDRPVSWTRTVGQGLAAYNNAGHGDAYVRARTPQGVLVNDSLWDKYNWRLYKYLARDYVGCMDSTSPNYNPQASVRSITQIDSTPGSPVYRYGDKAACPDIVSIRGIKGRGPLPGIRPRVGGFSIPVEEPGGHDVMVSALDGRQVFLRRDVPGGAGRHVEVNGLARGAYIVRVNSPRQGPVVAQINAL